MRSSCLAKPPSSRAEIDHWLHSNLAVNLADADTSESLSSAAKPTHGAIAQEVLLASREAATAVSKANRTFVGGESQNEAIAMTPKGGTFVVQALINGALSIGFVLDSGAADVSIPADVVMTLMRTGSIQSADFLGTRTYALADGSTVPSSTFRIRSLKVGDRTIENVTGSVASVKAPPLLGQSFLKRLKVWSIDNSKHALLIR